MKIGESSYRETKYRDAAIRRDESSAMTSPGDEVILSGRKIGERKSAPRFLSRSLLSDIEKNGLDGAGPLSKKQITYLSQNFPSPSGTLTSDSHFGIGGVLLPDSKGRITHLALQFGNVEFDRPLPEMTQKALLEVYRTLFLNMHPETRFTIAAADEKGVNALKGCVEESGMINPDRVNIIDGKAKKGFSIWIRDSMIPVAEQDGTTKILIQDRTYWPGPEDSKIPKLIDESSQDVSSIVHPALRIDGGNVLSNEEWIIVGKDSVVQTTKRLQELALDPEWKEEIISFYETKTGLEVVGDQHPPGSGQVTMEEMWSTIAPEVFNSEFQRKVFVISNDDPATPDVEAQPVFHIDMAVTPIGNEKFLVGDPGLAISVLEGLSPEEKSRVNKRMAEEAGLPADSDLIGKLIEVNGSQDHQANFDNVARELREKGYDIERLPCLIGLRTTWSLPYLTYNNCIQENYTDERGREVKKVYLPVYGCDPLESIAISAYERLGYEVVPLRMAAVSILEGAIRCSSYPLARTDVPPPGRK